MNNKILKVKKADERLISIWWFFSLLLISGAIIIMTTLFFSDAIDPRQTEAGILYNEISNCLIEQGLLHEEVFSSDFDFFEFCDFNKKLFEENRNSWFMNVKVHYQGEEIEVLNQGGESILEDCLIQFGTINSEEQSTEDSEIEYEHGAKCYHDKEEFLYKRYGVEGTTTEPVLLEIFVASNQKGKKGDSTESRL